MAERCLMPPDQFLLSGNTKSHDFSGLSNYGENDIWLAKTDASGSLIWQQTFGGIGLDYGLDAVEDSQRNLVVVGSSNSPEFQGLSNKGNTDLVVIKLQ